MKKTRKNGILIFCMIIALIFGIVGANESKANDTKINDKKEEVWKQWQQNIQNATDDLISKMKDHYVIYQANVQNVGWQEQVIEGQTAGTTNENKRMEAIKIFGMSKLNGEKITYQAHVQDIGWQDWKQEGELAGTENQSKQMEAIRIKFKTENSKYSIRYRTHVQDIGWQAWCYDGEIAGTVGESKKIEAIQIEVVPKRTIVTKTGTYGISGLKAKGANNGCDLTYYQYGSGPNVFFATFAVHGFEDKWGKDGTELKLIADEFYGFLKEMPDQSLAQKWTIYIFPEVNPDGRRNGWTNNGPGRTTLTSDSNGKGIDLNRCWSKDFVANYTDRNYTGSQPFMAYEARYLRDFMLSHKSKGGQTILVDLHGWTQQLIGDSTIRSYYKKQFPENTDTPTYGKGYMINWARTELGSSTKAAKAALIELPNTVSSPDDVKKLNLSNRYIAATLDMLGAID